MPATSWTKMIATVRNRADCGHIEAVELLHSWIGYKWLKGNASCEEIIQFMDNLDREFVDEQVKNSAK